MIASMARGAPEPAQAKTDFQWQGGSRVPPVVADSPEGPYLVSHSPVALPRLKGPLPGARLGTFAFAAGEIQVLTVVSIRVNPDGSPRYAGNPVTLTISGEMVFVGFPPELRSLTLLTDGLGQVHFNILFVRGSEALGAATAVIDAPPDYHVEIEETEYSLLARVPVEFPRFPLLDKVLYLLADYDARNHRATLAAERVRQIEILCPDSPWLARARTWQRND